MLDFHEGPGGRLVGCLAAWLVGWLACWLVGWLGHRNASKTCTLNTKVRQKCVPLGRKSTSKPFSFWGAKMRQKRVPSARKCVENVYPWAESRRPSPSASAAPECVKNVYPYHESASKMRTLKQKVNVASGLCIYSLPSIQKRQKR